jgi:hypothetical protein
MARYFRIDGKVARAAIAKGEYQDFFYSCLKKYPIVKLFMYLIVIHMNY